MSAFRRLLLPLTALLICLSLAAGVTFAYFILAKPPDGVLRTATFDVWLENARNGITSAELSFAEFSGSEAAELVFQNVFGNDSTAPIRFTVRFVPVWQTPDPSAPGAYIDQPWPVDMLRIEVDDGIGSPKEGNVYECLLQPQQDRELSLTVTVSVPEGFSAGSFVSSDSDCESIALKVKVFYEAVFAPPSEFDE